jgi:hypothetical protein
VVNDITASASPHITILTPMKLKNGKYSNNMLVYSREPGYNFYPNDVNSPYYILVDGKLMKYKYWKETYWPEIEKKQKQNP